MSEASLSASRFAFPVEASAAALKPVDPCGECLGSGGWYRYEPALDPAPGLLYLSCVECRGSGRTAPAGA
jgi:hypothetical protein